MSDATSYKSPLGERYASEGMRTLFSDDFKFRTWRRLWIALAESERELGLSITEEQLEELRGKRDDLNLDRAREFEQELRHDVMAHVHAYGEQCPKARSILHLGATSCFVGDNTDLVCLRDGLALIRRQLISVIALVADFAREWRALPTLGFTHYQPAQATTVGKRACLWLQDLVDDLADLDHAASRIRFRGVKGTTGTQASFLALFDGDHAKVERLDALVTEKMGFAGTFSVTGQTYPRQLDFRVLSVLSSVAQTAHKFATDLRLLANRREMEEPFGKKQIGSSAMPWKRNPMRSERICALSRFVISLLDNAAHTAANQWFERTLDDSANRRLTLAESFLATDSVLNLMLNVTDGMVVYPAVIKRNLDAELPFLATENLMMAAVRRGADRQDVHEAVRQLAVESARVMQEEGRDNPMRELLAKHPVLGPLAGELDQILDGKLYVGRAPEQVDAFLRDQVQPILDANRDAAQVRGVVQV